MQVFSGKLEDFLKEIDDVHMVWLEEIEQEAQRMFSRLGKRFFPERFGQRLLDNFCLFTYVVFCCSDFNTEPELMPKTPSQKKSNRRRRVSVGQSETRAKRR